MNKRLKNIMFILIIMVMIIPFFPVRAIADLEFKCVCFGKEIPEKIANLIRILYNGIRLAVPIILVIIGMIDMAKALLAKDDQEIKNAQNLLIKRGIAALLVFLVFSLVRMVLSISDETSRADMNCVTCIFAEEGSGGSGRTAVVESLTFSDTYVEMSVSDTKTIHLTLSPADAENKAIVLTSSPSGVVSLSRTLSADGSGYDITIKALSVGTATITVQPSSNSTIYSTMTVKVSDGRCPRVISNMYFDKGDIDICVGETKTVAFTIDATTLADRCVSFQEIGNHGYATINRTNSGNTYTIDVTGTGVGNFSYKVTANDGSARVAYLNVHVTNLPRGMSIDKSTITLSNRSTSTIYVTLDPKEALDNELEIVKKSCSDCNGDATISAVEYDVSTGKWKINVTGNKLGKAQYTISPKSVPSLQKSITVYVKAPVIWDVNGPLITATIDKNSGITSSDCNASNVNIQVSGSDPKKVVNKKIEYLSGTDECRIRGIMIAYGGNVKKLSLEYNSFTVSTLDITGSAYPIYMWANDTIKFRTGEKNESSDFNPYFSYVFVPEWYYSITGNFPYNSSGNWFKVNLNITINNKINSDKHSQATNANASIASKLFIVMPSRCGMVANDMTCKSITNGWSCTTNDNKYWFPDYCYPSHLSAGKLFYLFVDL